MKDKIFYVICLALILISVARLFFFLDKPGPEVFENNVGEKVSFKGIIIDEPDIREKNQKITVEVKVGNEETKVLITAGLDEDFNYGDEISVIGKLEKPENFLTDQGKTFDYIHYLKKDGIFYTMQYTKIEVLSHRHGNFVKSMLFFAKEKFLEKMNRAIPQPESLLMGGLILGEKSSFSQALRESFVNTGTIHIVALSGYNVTIVAEWIMKIFSFLPKNFGIGVGIFSIFLFVLMSGGSSTAVRAGIMAILALIARATGRNYDVARALILAGVFMVVLNPFVLIYDVSFQLSFLATIAVIFLSPKMEKYFMWIGWNWLRDIVTVTFSAYIFVTPFILYNMGNFSLVALPANITVLPFIPFTMLLGFITGFIGLIFFPFAIPFGYLSYFLLHYELGAIAFFSNLPFASFTIPSFPLWITILIYLFFFYKLFWKSIKKIFQANN
ncbi:MAG: ComEC/Rec2 family competence protein [Patescibacteria group bacterium]